jgi:hypothetical protein
MLTSHVASADRNCLDQNLFTDIRARYQSIVEDLLAIENPNDANLRTFQARHESGAFFCRYPNCPRSTIGFDSVELRKHHEDGHAPRFQCIDAACGFNGWTFKNREALDKHTSCYHEEEKIISIPESLGAWPRHSRRDRPLFRLNDPSSGRHRTSDRVEGLSDETESPGSQRGKQQGSSYSGRTLPQRMSDLSNQEINAQGFSFANSSANALQGRLPGSVKMGDQFEDYASSDYSQWQDSYPSETHQQSNYKPQSGGVQAGRGIDHFTPDSRDFPVRVDRLPKLRELKLLTRSVNSADEDSNLPQIRDAALSALHPKVHPEASSSGPTSSTGSQVVEVIGPSLHSA